MANICAHCGGADTAALFNTFECYSCGCHTTATGEKTLPTSLLAPPNHPESLESYGATTLPPKLVDGLDLQHPFTVYGDPFAAKEEVVDG